MDGREDPLENDVFFVCALIETIARKTKNTRNAVVQKLGENEIVRSIRLADVLHCEPIEYTAEECIQKYKIESGIFDNVADCKYTVPTVFDIAKVYKRLIMMVARKQSISPASALRQVYGSWISPKIDDYNSSMYYESPGYLFASYLEGKSVW
jgi:hypothetical protein